MLSYARPRRNLLKNLGDQNQNLLSKQNTLEIGSGKRANILAGVGSSVQNVVLLIGNLPMKTEFDAKGVVRFSHRRWKVHEKAPRSKE